MATATHSKATAPASKKSKTQAQARPRARKARSTPPQKSRKQVVQQIVREAAQAAPVPQVAASDATLGPGNFRRIARRADHAVQHVSRVLRGLSGCSFESAQKIAAAAGVTLDDMARYIQTQKTGRKVVGLSK